MDSVEPSASRSLLERLKTRVQFHLRIAAPLLGVYGLAFFVSAGWLGLADPLSRKVIFLYVALGVFLSFFLARHGFLSNIVVVVLYGILPAALTLVNGQMRFGNLPPAIPRTFPEERSSDTVISRPFLIHVSDTHFIKPGLTRTFQGEEWSAIAIAEIKAYIERTRPQYVLVSGDITDTGHDTEWTRALHEFLEPTRNVGAQVILAPGNHDLQPFFDDRSFWWALGPGVATRMFSLKHDDEIEHAERLKRFLVRWPTAISTVDGRRLDTITAPVPPGSVYKGIDLDKRWEACEFSCGESLTCHRLCSSNYELDKRRRAVGDLLSGCRELFPLIHEAQTHSLIVITLCSAERPTHVLFSNAIGRFDAPQLDRFRSAIKTLPAWVKLVIVMTHHTIARRSSEVVEWPGWRPSNWMTSAAVEYSYLGADWREARAIVEELTEARRNRTDLQFWVLYGHRHQSYIGRVGDGVFVSEAPAAYVPGAGAIVCERPSPAQLMCRVWCSNNQFCAR